jgi:hypothetical protein
MHQMANTRVRTVWDRRRARPWPLAKSIRALKRAGGCILPNPFLRASLSQGGAAQNSASGGAPMSFDSLTESKKRGRIAELD